MKNVFDLFIYQCVYFLEENILNLTILYENEVKNCSDNDTVLRMCHPLHQAVMPCVWNVCMCTVACIMFVTIAFLDVSWTLGYLCCSNMHITLLNLSCNPLNMQLCPYNINAWGNLRIIIKWLHFHMWNSFVFLVPGQRYVGISNVKRNAQIHLNFDIKMAWLWSLWILE